ncbi:Hsp20/alpha crystallin family protein [Planctomicrobium sp. SH668]|uniref:Hsp20/alpha crystallin family protein n=1 Tax=Planctomicrobium sp. SH668 TaxID=3448126 RepID=UPI003F5C76D0
MPVFRWGNPLHAFPDLEREMDRWMKRMDLAFEGLRLGRPMPALNVYSTEDAYLITAELAGCDPNAIEIHVSNGELTLTGSRALPREIPEERFRRSERPTGNWERSVTLPERVDESAIRAEFTNGLLKLRLPKLPATAPRQIKISETIRQEPTNSEGR